MADPVALNDIIMESPNDKSPSYPAQVVAKLDPTADDIVEEDQLADDDEEEVVDEETTISPADPKAPKKPARKPPSERTPGTSLLPASRITKIMKADKDLGITAKEAVFLVSIATEEFIKRLATEGHKQATRDGRAVITQKDLATSVKRADELLFLRDIVPLPIALPTAIAARKAKTEGHVAKNGSSSTNAASGAVKVTGAMDTFAKPIPRKVRAVRATGAPDGLANGQHTFHVQAGNTGGGVHSATNVDPLELERALHPSYYGDFGLVPRAQPTLWNDTRTSTLAPARRSAATSTASPSAAAAAPATSPTPASTVKVRPPQDDRMDTS